MMLCHVSCMHLSLSHCFLNFVSLRALPSNQHAEHRRDAALAAQLSSNSNGKPTGADVVSEYNSGMGGRLIRGTSSHD